MVGENSKLNMKLTESEFQFSKRMLIFFDFVGIHTVKDLLEIPLSKLTCYRGFKSKCKQELISFIESECIESFFEGFDRWKY